MSQCVLKSMDISLESLHVSVWWQSLSQSLNDCWNCDEWRCVLSLYVVLFIVWLCFVDLNRLWASQTHNHTSLHHTHDTYGCNFWITSNHCLPLPHTLTHTITIYLMNKDTCDCVPLASLHCQHNLYDECVCMFWTIATTHITHTLLNIPHINSYLHWHHISLSYVTMLKSQFQHFVWVYYTHLHPHTAQLAPLTRHWSLPTFTQRHFWDWLVSAQGRISSQLVGSHAFVGASLASLPTEGQCSHCQRDIHLRILSTRQSPNLLRNQR